MIMVINETSLNFILKNNSEKGSSVGFKMVKKTLIVKKTHHNHLSLIALIVTRSASQCTGHSNLQN